MLRTLLTKINITGKTGKVMRERSVLWYFSLSFILSVLNAFNHRIEHIWMPQSYTDPRVLMCTHDDYYCQKDQAFSSPVDLKSF